MKINYVKNLTLVIKKYYNVYTISDKAIYQKRRSTQAVVGTKKEGVPKP